MKIGIAGTRGIPNAYGGFEQFAEYLGKGLTEKGHEVWVYNSSDHPYQGAEWNGVHIIHCKDPESSIGTAGQFLYDFFCIMDARKRDFDILLQLGYTSNSIWHRWWPKNCRNIINMDGLEWKRSKYNKWTQKFLKRAEGWAAKESDALVADSIGIQDYLLKEYQKKSTFIPYGADLFDAIDPLPVASLGLEPEKYFLLIARMEPENNIDLILRGYLQSTRPYPLVLVGSTKNKYGASLQEKYSSDIIRFAGAIYDSKIINNLRYFSNLYFHGHSVGGTNPSLLEAMGCQCNIVAHENQFNKSILTNAAYYFSAPEHIANTIDHPVDEGTIRNRKKANVEKIQKLYNWPTVIDAYEKLFFNVVAGQNKLIEQPLS